ncbi:hypothetical protein ACA910_004463 [Epithemia clementina (nom. ined.)]
MRLLLQLLSTKRVVTNSCNTSSFKRAISVSNHAAAAFLIRPNLLRSTARTVGCSSSTGTTGSSSISHNNSQRTVSYSTFCRSPIIISTTTATITKCLRLGVPWQSGMVSVLHNQQQRLLSAAGGGGRRPWDSPSSSTKRRPWDSKPRTPVPPEEELKLKAEEEEVEEVEGQEAKPADDAGESKPDGKAGKEEGEEKVVVLEKGWQAANARKRKAKEERRALALARNKAEGVTRNGGGELYYDLPKKRRLTIQMKRDGVIIEIRQFYEDTNGRIWPSEKGITFNMEQFQALLTLIRNGTMEREIAVLETEFAKLAEVEAERKAQIKLARTELKQTGGKKMKKNKKRKPKA